MGSRATALGTNEPGEQLLQRSTHSTALLARVRADENVGGTDPV